MGTYLNKSTKPHSPSLLEQLPKSALLPISRLLTLTQLLLKSVLFRLLATVYKRNQEPPKCCKWFFFFCLHFLFLVSFLLSQYVPLNKSGAVISLTKSTGELLNCVFRACSDVYQRNWIGCLKCWATKRTKRKTNSRRAPTVLWWLATPSMTTTSAVTATICHSPLRPAE